MNSNITIMDYSKLRYHPLVSIIIPVYNGANFLSEAIESAINQKYDNFEIIVVNDGSTDNGETERIALSFAEKIRYLNKQNGGVSSALNLAITYAKGEWISWLSHDDLYFPEKISKQIEFINSLIDTNPTLDVNMVAIHSATISIDKNGKTIKIPSYSNVDVAEKPKDVILKNIYNYRLSGCSFLIPKKAFLTIGGFNEEIRTVSDVEYWYRLVFNGYQFYCLKNDALVKNRSHGSQVGKTKIELFNSELVDLYNQIFDKYYSIFRPSIKDIKVFYLGMIKRSLKPVAKRIKVNYIKGKVNIFDYYFCLPLREFFWATVGGIRNLCRNIFRRIFVYRKKD